MISRLKKWLSEESLESEVSRWRDKNDQEKKLADRRYRLAERLFVILIQDHLNKPFEEDNWAKLGVELSVLLADAFIAEINKKGGGQ